MNRKLAAPGHFDRNGIQDSSQDITNILNLLKVSTLDTKLASDFTQAFEIFDFQIGDELTNNNLSSQSGQSVTNEQYNHIFNVVFQGRVRLLGFDAAKAREISALVLEAGETFGADEMFDDISLPYRAIAASDGKVASIAIAKLQPYLEQLPQLRDRLQQQAIERQLAIFFKTSTELASLPSHTLRQLLPYLVATRIPAGEALAQSSNEGRFWLHGGQISKGENIDSPAVGESWGYPNPVPADWIAQTELLVYKLPAEHWEEVALIAPKHFAPLVDVVSSNGRAQGKGQSSTDNDKSASSQGKSGRLPNPKSKIQNLKSQIPPSPPTTEQEPIAFPQPSKGRSRSRWFGRRYPFIEQQSSSDCGAACLATIGQYWGKQFTLPYLRNLAGVGRSGASLKSLGKAAESLGFHARPVRASLSRLAEQKEPWIAHWQGDHYIVVYRVKGKRVLIGDPAVGKRSLSWQEFTASWTGYALLLDPTDNLADPPTEKNSLGRFSGLLWPHSSILWQIILASVLLQAFGLVTPLFTQVILDEVVVNKSFVTLHVFALGLILFGIGRIALTTTRQYLLDYLSNRLDLTLIGGFISHTLMLPLQFFASRRVGDIITRVQENQKIQVFLTRQVVLTWLDALMGVMYLGLMAYYNWQLTILVIALIPPIVILTLVATPLLRRVSREIFNETAQQNSTLVEMMTGVATVKAAAAEREVRWRWEDHLTRSLNVQFRGQNLSNGLQSISGFIHMLGSTALLWYGANLVIQEQLTIGQFVAFNMMIGNVINPVLSVVKLWDQFQEVVISVERLNDVFSAQPEESPQKPLLGLPRLQGEVQFENVTFRYSEDEERNTLQNISFKVEAGQTIAIVGRSGSGKSTLVNLLQALYHPNNGRIWMDGHDIRHVSPQSLRSQLGIVPQECFLFSGTILENITLYRPEFTLEQVVEVAKLAEAHAFIQDLPLGYNTKVGERGSSLSGGQRQRIAIARALLGSPRILILDEATSSLDTDSERRFQQNLARISRDRTTFIIAHRLSTVRHADCILVLDRGILTECGNHDELIALRGLYYHLAQQQLDL